MTSYRSKSEDTHSRLEGWLKGWEEGKGGKAVFRLRVFQKFFCPRFSAALKMLEM